ncbi:bi-domain-containing oxidoreductase [Aquibacillus albus]|uniref:Dehydrogenase/threonine dehydrogenase-like Zn-dependent dehydrogenase n=1 Tax=Aquibacillus albus TaxID=1168171 RepID=A0ABS2MZU4_9BACI|nr:bi-domain-containing oxidoreductase [Aquibacillus albus]MBM7571379.1 putative dehydrogenase/threonine dehydrogenase-like Zn-dependent dehydrogenase [Aquibacillus albus]
MKQLFLMVKDGTVKLIDTPHPTVKDNYVLVETHYSVVSAGTERSLTSFGGKNLLQKALERPDQVKKVTEKMSTDGILTTIDSAFNRLKEPMPMGYSGVGKIITCGRGVTEVEVGDIVAMAGHAYHSEVNRVNKNLIAKIPEEFEDYRQGALCALGGIALQGIHQANVVPGETVAVIGLGLLGHIVSRILNAYGCDVIGYDVVDKSLPGTNLKAFVNSNDENAEDITKSLTKGRGVDKVIITAAANSNGPMDLAAAIARDRGTICMIGVTQMNIDRRPYYDKELTFTIARSYGPGRYDSNYEEKGIDYPIGHVRFTEGRNIEEFIRLIVEKRADFSDLITHEIAFEKANEAYEMITTNTNKVKYIGILLKYAQNDAKWKGTVDSNSNKLVDKNAVSVGLIGAGNFAKNTLLPIMKDTGLYRFKGLATTGGVGSAQANQVFSFDYATNDDKELLDDDEIDLIVVSTQHNSHAKFIIEALEAEKHVYCEKPLCLTLDELEKIESTYKASKGELFCGMNRRHAPLIKQIKKKLNTDSNPAIYDYICNAGYIPGDHWTQDEKVGGGRIIGEACHFVDVIQYLDGSDLLSLNLSFVQNEAYPMKDNAIITLRFKSGAIGNIIYTSMGSKKYPKEQLRVFSNGKVYEMDNYIKMNQFGSVKKKKMKLRQDKGIKDEYEYIYSVLKGEKENTVIEDTFVNHRLLIGSK